MRLRVLHIFILFLLSIPVIINAQELKYGLTLGSNLSLVNVRSEYTLPDDYHYSPLPGINFGFVSTMNISDHLKLNGGVVFYAIRSRGNNTVYYRNELGQETKKISKINITNNYIQIKFNPVLLITEMIHIGTGLNMNVMINSKTKFIDYSTNLRLANYHYDPICVYVPVFISIETNYLTFNIGFNKALGSRIKDQSSLINEIDNHLYLEMNYFFNK